MKILVTGAGGFLGRHLAKAARRLGETVAVYRANPASAIENAVATDLSDPVAVHDLLESSRPDVILHAAARIPQSPDDDILTFFDDNVRATVNLYHAALATKIKRIVFSSSMSVYGPPRFLPVTEEHPAVPDFPYALSKIQGELTGRCFAGSGLETTVLRYSGIFGAGQRSGAVPAFISRCLQSAPLTLNAGGRPSSDFVWVDDAVQANLLAAQYSQVEKFEVMNIGSGVELSVLELAELIRRLTGSDSSIQTAENPSPRSFRFSYDISKSREKLGFAPTPMEAALKECIRQNQENQF